MYDKKDYKIVNRKGVIEEDEIAEKPTVRRPKRKWLIPEKFDGQTSSWSAFIAKFKLCAIYNGWNEIDSLAHLQFSL